MRRQFEAKLASDPNSAVEIATEKMSEATEAIEYYSALLKPHSYIERDQRQVAELNGRVLEVAELELCLKQANDIMGKSTNLIDWRLFGN